MPLSAAHLRCAALLACCAIAAAEATSTETEPVPPTVPPTVGEAEAPIDPILLAAIEEFLAASRWDEIHDRRLRATQEQWVAVDPERRQDEFNDVAGALAEIIAIRTRLQGAATQRAQYIAMLARHCTVGELRPMARAYLTPDGQILLAKTMAMIDDTARIQQATDQAVNQHPDWDAFWQTYRKQ